MQGAVVQLVTRGLIPALVLTGALLVSTACSSLTSSIVSNFSSPAESATQSAEDFRQERADALLDYVEAERGTAPEIESLYPGLYSEIRIEGSFEVQDGSRGVPAGEYAVVWFHYTYAEDQDWSVLLAQLDASRPELDKLCKETTLPTMKAAGVQGPRSAVWSYYDSRSKYGAMWTHSCSQWESTAQP